MIDNRAPREQRLKGIITDLHNSAPAQEVQAKLKTLVRETGHSEIMALQEDLIGRGKPAIEDRPA